MSVLKKTTIALLGVAVVAGSASASFAEKRGGKERGAARFEKMDANSDGKLDFEEFAAPLNKRFDAIDADSDGIITKAEIEGVETDGRREKRRVMNIAKRFDLNEDDDVTRAEVENRQQKFFALMDRNDDGFIEKTEIPMRGKHHGGKKMGDKKRGDRE